MSYGVIDIQELARLLGMDARLVERMAQRGDIPCQKIGGELRFNRAAITEWLQHRMGSMSDDHLAGVDAGMTAHRETDPEDAIIIPQLRLDAISTHLPARTRDSVLRELTKMATNTGLLYNSEELLEALNQREELCSTAMEAGIAMPHPRRPMPYTIEDPILVLAYAPKGIGYGAPDGKLTDLFIMTCSQDDKHHVHVLARLCRMLSDGDFVNEIRHAETPEMVMELMRQRELVVIADSR